MAASTELLHELIGAVNSLRMEIQRMNKNMTALHEEQQKVVDSCKLWGEWMEKDGPLVQLNLTQQSAAESQATPEQGSGDAPQTEAAMDQDEPQQQEPQPPSN